MLKPMPPSIRIRNASKPSRLERVRVWFLQLWLAIKRWWTGGVLASKLTDHGSAERTDAETAVERIVLTTGIAPDCVVATVKLGGPTIIIIHDKAQEGFVGKSYAHAADKAIEWLTKREGQYIVQTKSTKLSRKNIKVFDARRRDAKRQGKKRH